MSGGVEADPGLSGARGTVQRSGIGPKAAREGKSVASLPKRGFFPF